jgi:hypothetical protein
MQALGIRSLIFAVLAVPVGAAPFVGPFADGFCNNRQRHADHAAAQAQSRQATSPHDRQQPAVNYTVLVVTVLGGQPAEGAGAVPRFDVEVKDKPRTIPLAKIEQFTKPRVAEALVTDKTDQRIQPLAQSKVKAINLDELVAPREKSAVTLAEQDATRRKVEAYLR